MGIGPDYEALGYARTEYGWKWDPDSPANQLKCYGGCSRLLDNLEETTSEQQVIDERGE